MNELKKCEMCNQFIPWPLRKGTNFKVSKGNYYDRRFCYPCSREYQSQSIKGNNHYFWKGGKPTCINCGIKLSTYRKEGRCVVCWHKFLQIPQNHPGWKGDKVSNYKYVHSSLRKLYGNPTLCEFCGNSGRIEYAKKIKSQYTRNREDYLTLCKKCHFIYDGAKLANWAKNNSFSKEHRRKLSESHKGQIAWNKGKPWSQKIKDKISLSKLIRRNILPI
jgi:NUMOD3 motif